MRRLRRAVLALVLGSFARSVLASESPYEKDVRFALTEIEKQCGSLFEVKEIDWKKVSTEFLARAKKVKSESEHLALLVRLVARLRDGHAQVKPLEKGKSVELPKEDQRARGSAAMRLCRIGDRVFVESVAHAAEGAGVKPGMEVVRVNEKPVRKWLDERVVAITETLSFSTRHHTFAFACLLGAAEPAGTRFEMDLVGPDGKKAKRTVTSPAKGGVGDGPPFLIPGLRGKDVLYGKTEGGFGYVYLARCPSDLPEQMDEALEALGDPPGLVLDFRGNSGGGFDHDAFFGRFVPKGKSISFGHRYESAGPRPYAGPIVVIIDALAVSAGETSSGMFKEDGRGYVIGTSATAGMSSQKTTIDLPSGLFALYVSTGSNMRRFNGGRGIEGIGVAPHAVVEFDPKDLAAGKDTLLRRAEELLRKYPQEKVPYDPKAFGWKP